MNQALHADFGIEANVEALESLERLCLTLLS